MLSWGLNGFLEMGKDACRRVGFVWFALKIAKTNPFLLETLTDIYLCRPPPPHKLFVFWNRISLTLAVLELVLYIGRAAWP